MARFGCYALLTLRTLKPVHSLYVTSLLNVHVHVKAYMIEDDLGLFNIDDGKYTTTVTDFLVKQDGIVQVTLDSQKLMPEHEKDR